MNLLQACLKSKSKKAASIVRDMTSQVNPGAIWAILKHAAAWHEQRVYDTPHSTILVYSIRRMIEELGENESLIHQRQTMQSLTIPDDIKESLQFALIERLALHLASVDHWQPQSGPKYKIETQLDSSDNIMSVYSQSVREHSHMGALKAALALSLQDGYTRLLRLSVTMGAEEPDSLGHAFILPFSLLAELPHRRFIHPHVAYLWHLTEYMVRKVPDQQPQGFASLGRYDVMEVSTDISKHKELIESAAVEYGILGHNGIFAHRIADAAERGSIDSRTVDWLLKILRRNIGNDRVRPDNADVAQVIESTKGTDWDVLPSKILLPHSGPVRNWFSKNISDYWEAMLSLQASSFEKKIPDLGKDDWDLIRAAQYALSSHYGNSEASHTMIFAQAIWSLVDRKLLSADIASLQVYRMLRQYLKGR